ncbi:hypothetical protein [Imhoffiella purpurea]|uniref:Sulfur oxidation protein SoxA n=1 Tax=Imhoffiella purpurea TaxID=1249627 RepID=W9V998_9GAMM|nr:hypothetical protein [Imhoffiella purpurea]EXJ13436.1 sulfur oxidation protein SoxA [Imhoffiella purpurea]
MLKSIIPPAVGLAIGLGLFGASADASETLDGRVLWERAEGPTGKSCASCHSPLEETMRGRAATYPKFIAAMDREVTLEQRINGCRRKALGVEPWAPDAPELEAVAELLRSLD